jgi:hypothetical protein
MDGAVCDFADFAGYFGKTYITVVQYIGRINMSGLINAALGVLSSALYGAFSYAIAKVKNDESFDGAKFGKFLVIGFAVGALSSSLGIDMATVEGMSVATLGSIIVDKIAGAVFSKKK